MTINASDKESIMSDLIYIGITVAFFAISIIYTYACGKL
jgi:hypothetical protein